MLSDGRIACCAAHFPYSARMRGCLAELQVKGLDEPSAIAIATTSLEIAGDAIFEDQERTMSYAAPDPYAPALLRAAEALRPPPGHAFAMHRLMLLKGKAETWASSPRLDRAAKAARTDRSGLEARFDPISFKVRERRLLGRGRLAGGAPVPRRAAQGPWRARAARLVN